MGMSTAGKKWVQELATALGLPWPLPEEQPPRDEHGHGKRKRDVLDALLSFLDETENGNLLRVEPEFTGEIWESRATRTFTVVFRPGAVADRLERHLSATSNSALATASSFQMLCLRLLLVLVLLATTLTNIETDLYWLRKFWSLIWLTLFTIINRLN